MIDVEAFDRERVLRAADGYLSEEPVTITAVSCPRSAGGRHDYFSEGDYWWPDPSRPGGPYVRRDGERNPELFEDHRRLLRRMSVQVPALAAAWQLTGDPRYARRAVEHLRAWFVDPATRMNPHLRYSQAILGKTTGRSYGIIDTIHLIEVARAVEALGQRRLVADWFRGYLRWLLFRDHGRRERRRGNNHGTAWVAQAAAFARLTGAGAVVWYCRRRFKTVLVPKQMSLDGSFPRELSRTRPLGYSLFNLELMAVTCELASTPHDDLWNYELPDGRGMRRALEFMAPFVRDVGSWPHPRDVEHHEAWPMRHQSLLLGGIALGCSEYVDLWKGLPADSDEEEVLRNFFLRQPVLWAKSRGS